MKTMQVADLKAQFSRALDEVRNGEEIVVSYGRSRTSIAVLVPYESWVRTNRIRLGLLEGRVAAEFASDYAMSDEELLGR